jgi:KUP system potassium uptake protein
VRFKNIPFAAEDTRLDVKKIAEDVYLIIIRYGFMDDVDIPAALAGSGWEMPFNMMETTFFFSRENPIPTKGGGMIL